MKKPILKTALICLGITLLCGMYSFKTPEGMKSQQRNRTMSIAYDTIITPDGEESECVKEVVVESDQGEGSFSLAVHYASCNYGDICDPGNWYLYATNNYSRSVKVTYKYRKYGKRGDVEIDTGIAIVSGQYWGPVQINSGNLADGVFELIDIIEVCFPYNDAPNNQNQ